MFIVACCSLLGCNCLILSLSLLLVRDVRNAMPQLGQNLPSPQHYPQVRRASFLLNSKSHLNAKNVVNDSKEQNT
jgi:hypothetical protein